MLCINCVIPPSCKYRKFASVEGPLLQWIKFLFAGLFFSSTFLDHGCLCAGYPPPEPILSWRRCMYWAVQYCALLFSKYEAWLPSPSLHIRSDSDAYVHVSYTVHRLQVSNFHDHRVVMSIVCMASNSRSERYVDLNPFVCCAFAILFVGRIWMLSKGFPKPMFF